VKLDEFVFSFVFGNYFVFPGQPVALFILAVPRFALFPKNQTKQTKISVEKKIPSLSSLSFFGPRVETISRAVHLFARSEFLLQSVFCFFQTPEVKNKKEKKSIKMLPIFLFLKSVFSVS
jgi:hypothetical protein